MVENTTSNDSPVGSTSIPSATKPMPAASRGRQPPAHGV
jgi:hypothetical protein